MHVLALRVELHLPQSRSLKAKRAAMRPIVDGLRARLPVAVAETDHQDAWQLGELGVAIVSGSARQCRELGDEVERFVWSRPDVEVSAIARTWLDTEE